jgi:alanine dehydrogenase
MIVGVVREIREHEYRVGMVPGGVRPLVMDGHRVLVETRAGEGSGLSDEQYNAAGAEIVADGATVYRDAELIVKVKEPQPAEFPQIRPGQMIFGYFHLASSEKMTRALLASGATCIAYETIQTPDGRLPCLTPMSEVAGRMAVQEGAKYLEKPMKGRGILLSGVPGVQPAEVLVLGGGIVGASAARVAAGLGARVVVLDVNLERLRYLADVMPPNVITLMSNEENLIRHLRHADLVIGAVLVPGARAPVLIRYDMLKHMMPGAVIVDVCIDQGGCLETSRPTTHADPVYEVDGIIHYCVTNMPGAVGRTSTFALTNVTLPYARKIAALGLKRAAAEDSAIRAGVNISGGRLTLHTVAEQFGLEQTTVEAALETGFDELD